MNVIPNVDAASHSDNKVFKHPSFVLAALLDEVEGCIKLINLKGELEYLSPRGLCLLEIDDENTVLGNQWSALWPSSLQPKIEDTVRLALLGESSVFNASCPTAKDNLKHWEVRVGPYYDNEKNILGIISISTDKTAEESLTEANIELARSEKEKLEKTLKLKKINKELSEFSHMAAHDLKTPLNNIHSYASLLMDKINANELESSAKYAQTIRSEISKMSEYVDDLLAFSSSVQYKLKTSSIDVISALDYQFKRIIRANSEKRIDYSYQNVPQSIIADEIKLASIFQNLIENAVKYSNQQVHIKISYSFDSDKSCHHFIVEDNGIGIQEKNYEKIFLPFRRASKIKQGTGIGLALVRNFVQLHGGEVWVESKVNTYSKFHFTIAEFKLDNGIITEQKES